MRTMDDELSTRSKMEDCVDSDENISESFICCICLELLYKPIVLSCGHVSCFWCVHKSMSGLRESHCPFCRHPYHFFPTICRMLYFLLLKMYPLAYKRREHEILEEEKQMGCFSPQLDDNSSGVHPHSGLTGSSEPEPAMVPSSPSNKSSVPCSSIGGTVTNNVQQSESCPLLQDNHITAANQENNLSQSDFDGTCNEVSIADVLCSACKQLLFHPAVLNCGHVYCETCIAVPEDDIFRCRVCESPHPSDFPKVCLEFSKFLEEKFPKEYASRRDAVQCRQVRLQNRSRPPCSKNTAKKGFPSEEGLPLWGEGNSKVHFGAGCDSCGMFPIVGDRYRCKDCVEAIGFDLCGDCYNTRSKLPGRFNQQHTPDHKFELAKPFYVTEDLENGSIPVELVVAEENAEDNEDAPVNPDCSSTEEEQNEVERAPF
ncbi:hypothetical protein Ancab_022057 [Ancistrocladus abbreviatus]